MWQVQGEAVTIEAGWALLITFAALAACSFGVRFARDEHCTICGQHLIWLQTVREWADTRCLKDAVSSVLSG